MDSTTRYEIMARAFYNMTGHMAPGKDAAAASYPAPYEERAAAWDKWIKENNKTINAMLLAFESEITTKGEE